MDLALAIVLYNALKDKFTGVTPPITNGKKPFVPTVTPPSTTPTLFGDDPFVLLFPAFIPDPEFVVEEPKGRPQCALGEKAIFDTNTNQYRCVPKLL